MTGPGSLTLALFSLTLAAVTPAAAWPQPSAGDGNLPDASPVLAEYDFEAPTPSGPDTFWVRQPADAEVALSTAFRRSGERSLHVSEVDGNRDFAEFLAYFPERREGSVFVQFYLLLTDPEQRFNLGLAGAAWFLSIEPHGHAVWMQTADGFLRHRHEDGWQDLFAPRPFAWYFVDLVFDVDRGRYDLRIYEEGVEEPVLDLRRVPGLNGHPGSSVRYLSFIGDLEDAGRFDFFVDDLLIASDPAVLNRPFVAPGRRSLFVDSLAVAEPADLSEAQLEDLLWQTRSWLDRLAVGDPQVPLKRLEAAADAAFRSGALELARGDLPVAPIGARTEDSRSPQAGRRQTRAGQRRRRASVAREHLRPTELRARVVGPQERLAALLLLAADHAHDGGGHLVRHQEGQVVLHDLPAIVGPQQHSGAATGSVIGVLEKLVEPGERAALGDLDMALDHGVRPPVPALEPAERVLPELRHRPTLPRVGAHEDAALGEQVEVALAIGL